MHHFLTAFENLEWEPFRSAFADSATVFHPAPNMPGRVTGRAAIDSTFRIVFADVRAHATGGPPFHHLTSVDLRIQPLAPDVVLATFELHNAERLARRTVVFRREGDAWRIVQASKARFNGRSFTLTIAGEGPQQDELEAQARSLGIADKVLFRGFISQKELRELFLRNSETPTCDVKTPPRSLRTICLRQDGPR